MAHALTLARMPASWRGSLRVLSAGTGAFEGLPASAHARSVLGEIGVDLSSHRSRLLTAKMIEEADLIVAMTKGHRDEILESVPRAQGKVIVLGELDPARADSDMADPMGGDEEDYRRARRELERLVDLLIDYVSVKFGLRR